MIRLARVVPVLALCLVAAGCSRLEEVAMPVPRKINAAFPPSAEVQLAQERLARLLSGNVQDLEAMQSQLEARLTLRALDCSKNVTVGRLATLAAVRQLPLDRQCFQEQDQALTQFLGARSVGTLLRMPPLRPLSPAGEISTLPRGALSHIVFGSFARDAGVAVLRDGIGEAVVVEVPGGRPIAKLPRAMVYEPNSHLSPNGRVLATRSDTQDLVFYEAETGSRVWEASGSSNLLAWLPELASLIVSGRDGVVGLVDGLRGELTPHPVAAKNSAFRAHLPGPGSRLLIGGARSLSLVTHERTADGIRATLVKELPITSTYGITSGHPVAVLSGRRLVFPSMRDLGWLDLDSGESGTWAISPHFGNRIAKLDENRLMIDSVIPNSMGLKPWVFDLTTQTVAPVELGGQRGLLVDIGERIGFMRRADQAWFGDTVKAGEPVPLERVLADMDLQRQLAKLQSEAASTGAGTGAAARGEAVVPGLENVPADAQVHIVGVYEGKAPTQAVTTPQPAGTRMARDVRVLVRSTGKPIVLVLASYEPVQWNIVNAGGRLSAILLSGYHPSNVSGAGTAPVLRIGTESAYQPEGGNYLRLRQAVTRYTGPREVRSFQGLYSGSEFSVGGQ